MKKRDVTNLPASVHDRLLKIAKERGTEFQDLLINYALERWLYRMTQSAHQDRSVAAKMVNVSEKDNHVLFQQKKSWNFYLICPYNMAYTR